MTESFAEIFEESNKDMNNIKQGSILKGKVIDIDNNNVIVDAGLKSESVIPIYQFKNNNGELEVAVGDETEVALDAIEDGYGETILSREKAKRNEAWKHLETAFSENKNILGNINSKVKGGFTVDVNNIKAFLPGSLVDIRPIRDTSNIEGKDLEFKVIKLDKKRNNVVVSRRAVIESESSVEREALISNIEEGLVIDGTIKNLTEYGAFVDLGGIDGLLHITDMSWKRVKHPSEIVNIGDEVKVKVLKFDKALTRVSLGLKQLGEDPWINISQRYPEKQKIKGIVTNLTDYGCFIEIEEGVEGLVHVSEMDWTNKNIHPSKVISLGSEVEVMVLEINEEKRRISLGLKQCKENPWIEFAEKYKKSDHVKGKIKSITEFGIFIGLDGGIDGLVHLSDICWSQKGEEKIKDYKKNQEVEAIVLSVDPEKERVSLGIKQLQKDTTGQFLSKCKKGDIVPCQVKSIESKMISVLIENEVEGTIKIHEIPEEELSNLEVDAKIEAKIINIDRKNRSVALSVKAKNEQEEKQAMESLNSEDASKKSENAMSQAFKAALSE